MFFFVCRVDFFLSLSLSHAYILYFNFTVSERCTSKVVYVCPFVRVYVQIYRVSSNGQILLSWILTYIEEFVHCSPWKYTNCECAYRDAKRNTGVKIKKRLALWFNFFFFFNNRKTGFLIDWSHVFRSRATQRLVSALYRGSSARVEAGTSDVAGKLSSNICNYVYFFLT